MKLLQNKTKIVATLGPATSSKDVMRELIKNGVNVFRLNFSHGKHEDVAQQISLIRELDAEMKSFTAILADLQGPKIRIGEVEGGSVQIKDGQELNITTTEQIGNANKVYLNYDNFPKDVHPGEQIVIDDGKLVLEIVDTDRQSEVRAKVVHGGTLSSRKGVNLPNTAISLPCLTDKDLKDLKFILTQDVDWLALSFVRSAGDIAELRELVKKANRDIKIIAKIEKPQAVKNLDAIIDETDGVMVARGDLGVEVPMQEVPLIQKSIVRKCQRAAKPVIIATQMMESMIENISPTRAEVNDVANAVLDGADAVMLSGETSVGRFPVEVIKNIYKIILEVEGHDDIYYKEFEPEIEQSRFISDNICFSAVRVSKRSGAKGIATMTFSGYTAYKIASFRPKSYVFVFTGNVKLLNKMSLVWGTRAFYYDRFVSTDQTIDDIKSVLKDKGHLSENDLIINIASMPIADKGMSNMLRLSKVG